MVNILNLEPQSYSPLARNILLPAGSVVDGPLSREGLLSQIDNYDVLIVRLGHQIDSEILDKASRLKVIVSATTGLNHIDLDVAAEKNIAVLSLKGERAFLDTIHATAEHAFALMLSLIRHVPSAHADVRKGNWNRDAFKGRELHGKTLGIIGLGRLGRKVAEYARAFGMRVIAHDKDKSVSPVDVAMVELSEIAAQADFVSIHIPSSPENHEYIDARFYGSVKPGVFIINTARGDVHDQEALLKGLQNGLIAGAALDVLQEENTDNIQTSPLLEYARTHENLIITPHIGGATSESMEKTEIFMAHKLKDWLEINP